MKLLDRKNSNETSRRFWHVYEMKHTECVCVPEEDRSEKLTRKINSQELGNERIAYSQPFERDEHSRNRTKMDVREAFGRSFEIVCMSKR